MGADQPSDVTTQELNAVGVKEKESSQLAVRMHFTFDDIDETLSCSKPSPAQINLAGGHASADFVGNITPSSRSISRQYHEHGNEMQYKSHGIYDDITVRSNKRKEKKEKKKKKKKETIINKGTERKTKEKMRCRYNNIEKKRDKNESNTKTNKYLILEEEEEKIPE